MLKSQKLTATFFFASLLMLTGVPGSALALTFNVTKTADTKDGVCDADCSLREAIDAANANGGADTINLPAGAYVITRTGAADNTNTNGDFDVTSGPLIIIGAGSETTSIDGGNLERIFHSTPYSGADISITGVKLFNGTDVGNGGCLYTQASSLTLDDTLFTDCHGVQGGAIYKSANSGTFSITNSSFTSNTATTDGGAIFSAATMALTGVTVTGNSNGGGTYQGGGIRISSYGVTTTITDSVISNNTSGGTGGGFSNAGHVILNNTTVSGNSTTGGNGGGIYAQLSLTINAGSVLSGNTAVGGGGGAFANTIPSVTSATISNNTASGANKGGGLFAGGYSQTIPVTSSTFSGNNAGDIGGGLYVNGHVTIADSTFSGNTSSGNGGGYYASLSSALSNSTFSGNSGSNGAGFYSGGATTITNSTVSGNNATAQGGGFYINNTCTIKSSTIYGNTSAIAPGGGTRCSTINTTLSILANNTAAGGADNCYGTSSVVSGGYNSESASTCGFSVLNGDQVNTDPMLKVLGNYGGATLTHEPQLGSPVIDTGDNTLCAAAPINNLDQRGVTRPLEGDGFAPNNCDIGAVEYKLYTLKTAAAGGGSVTSSPGSINCYTGACYEDLSANLVVTLTATPDAGYVFSSWSGACTGSGSCVVTMDGDKSVIATFTPTGAAQTLTTNVVGTGNLSSSYGGIDCPDLVCAVSLTQGTNVTLTPAASAGYVFDSWSGDCTGTGACNVTLDAAKNVTATFVIVQYPLDVAVTGSGAVTSVPGTLNCPSIACSENFDYNTAVALTATPDANYKFVGWSGACIGNTTCNVTIDEAKSVAATFSIISYPLNVVVAGGSGTVTSAPGTISCTDSSCAETFSIGASVALTATAAPGYNFTGWSGACTGTGACNVTMDAAKTVTANFAINTYTFDLVKAGTGTGVVTAHDSTVNCGATCSAVYDAGKIITLTATPDAGNRFDGWSGGICSGTWICNVTMDAAKSVTATFSPSAANSFTVTKFIDTKDGSCSQSDCSLREAIDAANAQAGADIIYLPAGTYTISLPDAGGVPENSNATGDFDITGPITFIGDGSGVTFIDGGEQWRIFHTIPYSGADVTITGVTFFDGLDASHGGCIFTQASSLILTDTLFTNCNGVNGGAVYKSGNAGVLTVDSSTFTQNHASGEGGAIFSSAGITLNNTTITNNSNGGGTFQGGGVAVTSYSVSSTITDSTISNNSSGGDGGAIYANGHVTINNSTLNNNSVTDATSGGGAVRVSLSLTINAGTVMDGNTAAGFGGAGLAATIPSITGATITNNSSGAGKDGGAFYASSYGQTINVVNSMISNNATGNRGGAIYVAGHVTTSGSTFNGNVSDDSGGAIFASLSLAVDTSTFDGNTAVGLGGAGNATAVSVTDSQILNNKAVGGTNQGGGFYARDYGATSTVTNSSLINNAAVGDGGAIFSAGIVNLYNSTVSGNSSGGNGGGLRVNTGCSVINSTVYGNTLGGGVWRQGGTCTYKNTIIANNTGGNCLNGGTASGGNNIEDFNTCLFGQATDKTNTDPQLLPVGNTYGGNTYVHALRAISPAIDAGDDATCAAAPINSIDQRGFARPLNGDLVVDADGNECDIGAVEFEPYQLSVVITGVGQVTSSVGGIDCTGVKCANVFAQNEAVSLTASVVPGSGYLFDSWSGACSGTGICNLTMDTAKDAIANYVLNPITHSLSVTAVGAGSITSSPGTINCTAATCNENFAEGTWVTLTPNPDPGYELTSWSGACTGAGACVVTIDAASSVTGTFGLIQRSLTVMAQGYGTVTSTPAGISCTDGNTCSASFDEGTAVTLTATPRPGYLFSGWSNDCSAAGTGSCALTMDADKYAMASFPTFRNSGVFMNSEHGGKDATYPDRAYYPLGDGVTGVSRAHLDSYFERYPRGECYHCHDFSFNPLSPPQWPMTFDDYTTKEQKVDFCGNCHTDADPDANGIDYDSPNEYAFKGPTEFKKTVHYKRNLQWPGGQYGSSYPAMPAAGAGTCINCHSPHAHTYNSEFATMPAGVDPSTIPFPKQLVELMDIVNGNVTLPGNWPDTWPNVNGRDPDDAEDLCYTCHDGDPVQNKDLTAYNTYMKTAEAPESPDVTSIKEAFNLAYHHPVKDSEQQAIVDADVGTGNSVVAFRVECPTCHNPHLVSGTWNDFYTDVTATPLVLPVLSNDWPSPAVPGYVKGEAWGDEPEEKVNALLQRMAESNPAARGTGGWAFNVARGYALETNNNVPFDQAPIYQPPYGGPGPERGFQPDGDHLPDFLTFCLDCHQNDVGSKDPIGWGASWPDVAYRTEPHGFDPANIPNYWECGATCVAGDAPCLDELSSERDPSDPFYNKPQSQGYQTWSLPPYKMEDRMSGANYVLVCTDCHEPHGSARRSLLRDHINGNNINEGGSVNVCTSCHYDWGGVMVGYPGADDCGNGTPVGCATTGCHGSVSLHRLNATSEGTERFLRDPNYIADTSATVSACTDNGRGVIGLWSGKGTDDSNNSAIVAYTNGTYSDATGIINTRNGGNFRTLRKECHSLRYPDTAWNSGTGSDPQYFTYEGKIKFVPNRADRNGAEGDDESSIEMSLIDYTLSGAGANWAVRLSNRCCTADGNADGIADGDPGGDLYLQIMINVWDQDQVNPWRIAYSKIPVPEGVEGYDNLVAVAATYNADDPVAPLRVYINGDDVTDGLGGSWTHDPAVYNPSVANMYSQPIGMSINARRHEDDCVVGDATGAPDGNCLVTWDAKNLNPYMHFAVDATVARPWSTDLTGKHNFWGYMGKQRLLNSALTADQVCSDVVNIPGDTDWDTTVYNTNVAADCSYP